MILKKNYDNYTQEDSSYRMVEESINYGIMKLTNPVINQQLDDARSAEHQPTELDHDDADRRTLDESEADEDDSD
jgi:hypothetical protein